MREANLYGQKMFHDFRPSGVENEACFFGDFSRERGIIDSDKPDWKVII
jgi:hypothetical protein